jgi:hypothetical protein
MAERFPTPSREEIALLEPFERIGIDRVSLVSTGSHALRALDALAGAAVLGFDTESKPTFAKNELSEGPHIRVRLPRSRGAVALGAGSDQGRFWSGR